jgi:uncharacterized protein
MSTNFDVQHSVQVLTGIRIPMRDGVELNVKITRPVGDGPFPAVLEYNPYRRLTLPLLDYRDEYPPIVPYLAERGYAVVQFDVRGTGSSSGFTTDIYSDAEIQDGYDMVEWIAIQPWSNGRVGMIGKSYSAVVQWQVAVRNPPHLKTIIVRSANDDVYTEWTNPGGAIRPYMFESYAPIMNAFNFAPPDPHLTKDQWSSIWKERLIGNEPWSLNWIRNTLHGPYWRSKSLAPGYDRVQCSVFLVEGWADWYSTAELRAFQNLTVPKKVLIGPWGHYYAEERGAFPGPRIDGRREYLKWLDYWLKGVDNGVMDEPPVTVFVRKWKKPGVIYLEDAGYWRNDIAWPPEGSRLRTLYFGNHSRLLDALPDETTAESFDYRPSAGLTSGRYGRGNITPWAMPLDQRQDEAHSLLFTTEELTEELNILGDADVLLYISSTADVAYFHIKLCDLASDGTSKLLADGGLLASHRNSHEKPEPIEPGQVYELHFCLKHCAYTIAPGHRLRVMVASADFQNAWPTPKPARNTVFCGKPHASRISVPISPASRLTTPKFADSEYPLPKLSSIPAPEYGIHMDLIRDTVTSGFVSPPSVPPTGVNSSRFTVSNANPARATIDSSVTYLPPHPTLKIEIEATCQTTSDENTYSHLSQVDIEINGQRYFSKSWAETVPRRFS